MKHASIYHDKDKDDAGSEDHAYTPYEELAARWEAHMITLYGSKLWDTIDAQCAKEKTRD